MKKNLSIFCFVLFFYLLLRSKKIKAISGGSDIKESTYNDGDLS